MSGSRYWYSSSHPLSSKYAICFSIFGVILFKAISEFPAPFNQQPERKNDEKINKRLIFIRKITSLKNFTNRAWTYPAFQNYCFFRLLFKKPLDRRLSHFLAIMTRITIEAQHLKKILQKNCRQLTFSVPLNNKRPRKRLSKYFFPIHHDKIRFISPRLKRHTIPIIKLSP